MNQIKLRELVQAKDPICETSDKQIGSRVVRCTFHLRILLHEEMLLDYSPSCCGKLIVNGFRATYWRRLLNVLPAEQCTVLAYGVDLTTVLMLVLSGSMSVTLTASWSLENHASSKHSL